MALIDEITDSILLAKSFQTELTDELLYDQKRGCMDCKDQRDINHIENLVLSLENRISRNTMDEDTVKIYNCLLTAIANYSGSSLPVDPNANVPNLIIDVTIIGNNQPNELTFYWSDLINNGEDGRIRYENPDWAGWNPMLSVGNMPYLEVDIDYTVLETGGFVLLPTGNVPFIYEDQIIRSVGYEPYSFVGLYSFTLENIGQLDIPMLKDGVEFILPVGATYPFNFPIVGGSLSLQFNITNPVRSTGVVAYQQNGEVISVGQSYTSSLVGLQIFPEYNNAKYEAEQTALPFPPAGTYSLVNNSTIDTSYFITSSIPLPAGNSVANSFTIGQSLLGVIENGQRLIFTRYLSDGTVDTTLELTNPPSTQLNTSIIDLTKSYEFIYTDNI